MSFPVSPSDPTARPTPMGLPEADRAAALARFRVLRPHLEEGVPLARLAREQGLELRTLQRWLRAYRQQGFAGLTRKARRDRGSRNLPTSLICWMEGARFTGRGCYSRAADGTRSIWN